MVTAIMPQFGPVKSPNDEKAILTGSNFECPKDNCDNVVVRFGDTDFGTIVPGKVLDREHI